MINWEKVLSQLKERPLVTLSGCGNVFDSLHAVIALSTKLFITDIYFNRVLAKKISIVFQI